MHVLAHRACGRLFSASAASGVEVASAARRFWHYGNPKHGCRADEDAITAGTGRVCAPRVGVTHANVADVSLNSTKCGAVTRYH